MVAEALSDIGTKVPKSVSVDIQELGLDSGASITATIVTPSSGKRIVVTGLFQIAVGGFGGNTHIEFLSGTDEITGVLTSHPQAANSPVVINTAYMPDGHFWTAKDEPLNVKLTNGHGGPGTKSVTLNGAVQYYED